MATRRPTTETPTSRKTTADGLGQRSRAGQASRAHSSKPAVCAGPLRASGRAILLRCECCSVALAAVGAGPGHRDAGRAGSRGPGPGAQPPAPADPAAQRPDVPAVHRPGDDRRDRARRHRPVRRRPHQGRVRRSSRMACTQEIASVQLVHGGRTFNLQAPPAPAPQEGIILPAGTPDQRRRGPHLPVLRRRPAHELPRHVADPAALREDEQDAAPRRRHVRRRLHGHLVDRHRPHLRQEADGRGDQEDCRQRAQAERAHRGAAGPKRQQRAEVPGARRVFDRLRHRRQPVEGPEPPEGRHLRQQRLRLQPV